MLNFLATAVHVTLPQLPITSLGVSAQMRTRLAAQLDVTRLDVVMLTERAAQPCQASSQRLI